MTARADEPGAFWTLGFGYGFDEATPGRMMLVDEDLKPLSGGRPNPGVRFHGSAHFAEWPGVPVAADEGRIISAALGDSKTILLANHGLLATGTYVEEAAYCSRRLSRRFSPIGRAAVRDSAEVRRPHQRGIFLEHARDDALRRFCFSF